MLKSSKIFSTVLVLIQFNNIHFAQEVPKQDIKKIQFKTIGTIAISADTKQSLFLNFGGPSVRFDYEKFGISYNMFPSLRFFYGDSNENTNPYKTKNTITPILGTGISLYYKKLAVVAPMYYLPSNNVWLGSFGLGYKF